MAKVHARKSPLADGDHRHTDLNLTTAKENSIITVGLPTAASVSSCRTALLSAGAPPVKIMATFSAWPSGFRLL